jgi:hypothetical protein
MTTPSEHAAHLLGQPDGLAISYPVTPAALERVLVVIERWTELRKDAGATLVRSWLPLAALAPIPTCYVVDYGYEIMIKLNRGTHYVDATLDIGELAGRHWAIYLMRILEQMVSRLVSGSRRAQELGAE